MKIITGKRGEPHVSSSDDRALHAGTFGTGDYVLATGNKLSASIISANVIRLASGDGVMQGTHFRIPHGQYDDINIDSGTSGYMRKDLIVARYQKVGDIESVTPVVIKGTSVTSDPQRPAYTVANILGGALTADMPLYEVTLNGVNIESVVSLFSTIITTDELNQKVDRLEKHFNNVDSEINERISSVEETLTKLQTTLIENISGLDERVKVLEEKILSSN